MKKVNNRYMKSSFKLSAVVLALTTLTFVGCRKEYDHPPVTDIPDGNYITISDIKNMVDTTGGLSINFDYNVYAVVTMDESTGNIYKNVFVQDATGAINLRLLTGGGLYQGDSIRINLNGTYINNYQGMYQVDSVDVDKNVVKQATNIHVEPLTVTVDQINPTLQARLVRIENVEFVGADLNSTWADEPNQQSLNKTLTDCNENTILVRSSGYADFAGDTIPDGSGTFIGIITQFNTDMQLLVRAPNELLLNSVRCTGFPIIPTKNFEDQSITSGGWSTYQLSGPIDWETNNQGTGQEGDYYANISNYNGSNVAAETWLISPNVDLSNASTPTFSFINAYSYSGDPLEVYISTDYTSGDPNNATWAALNPILSSGSFEWENSGSIDLSSYIGSSVRVGFKYTGSNSNGSTWEIDQIKFSDQ